MKKLIIIQAVAPAYRTYFFSMLNKSLGTKFDLYAGKNYFAPSVISTTQINYKKINNYYLLNRKFLFQKGYWSLINSNDILVMELNPRNITTWIFLIVRKLYRKKTILWGHAWPRKGMYATSDKIRHLMRLLSNQIIVYTKQQQNDLQKKMPLKKISAAPNALYPASLMTYSQTSDMNNLIYVGRLTKAKKVDLLIRHFHLAISQVPENMKLMIIGDGPLKNNIEQYIKKHQLENRIKLLGQIDDYKQLKKYYHQSIFSVSPGYAGLSIIQSFSFGIPILLAKEEKHSPEIEAIIENENSLYYDNKNSDDFVEKLKNIIQNKSYWSSQRKNIVDFCKKNYSTEYMAKTFIELVK